MLKTRTKISSIACSLAGLLTLLALSLAGANLMISPLAEARPESSTRPTATSRAPTRSPEVRTRPNRQNSHYQSYLQKHLNQPGRIERDHSVASFSGVVYNRHPASTIEPVAEEETPTNAKSETHSRTADETSSEKELEP